MKKGVLIIAVGHKDYLGMAINLIASIRVNDPGLAIALATDVPPPVWLHEKKLIDVNVHVPAAMITHKKEKAYIKAKLHMLDLSPFDETIFLDADQILIAHRSLLPIFDQLKDIDVTISNTGINSISYWADIAEVKTIYGEAQFWNFHSEFIYFKKTAPAKLFFKTAKKVFSDNKIQSAKKFDGAPMADELAFQAASMITGIYPHKQNWTPNFWFNNFPKLARSNPYQLKEFITYSIGGNNLPRVIKTNYLNLATHYFNVLGLKYPYQPKDKKQFLTNRKTF